MREINPELQRLIFSGKIHIWISGCISPVCLGLINIYLTKGLIIFMTSSLMVLALFITLINQATLDKLFTLLTVINRISRDIDIFFSDIVTSTFPQRGRAG